LTLYRSRSYVEVTSKFKVVGGKMFLFSDVSGRVKFGKPDEGKAKAKPQRERKTVTPAEKWSMRPRVMFFWSLMQPTLHVNEPCSSDKLAGEY